MAAGAIFSIQARLAHEVRQQGSTVTAHVDRC